MRVPLPNQGPKNHLDAFAERNKLRGRMPQSIRPLKDSVPIQLVTNGFES